MISKSSKTPAERLLRAIRMTSFLAKNPLREARAIVAACVAQQIPLG